MVLAATLGVLGGMGGLGGATQGLGQTGVQAQPNQNAQGGERNTGSRGGIFSQDAARIGFGREPNPRSHRRRGPGWTQAHVKRMARKAQNIKRHRAVMKRAK
jgi:hypothetical protein